MTTKLNRPCECEHEFTLVLKDAVDLTEDVENALFEAGCDDATLSVRSGRLFLTFARVAESMKDAVLSAINDVREADIGTDVLRVDDCNLVTQADIARKIGRSRQQVHQYVTGTRGPGRFPAPVCEIATGAPLWQWCAVAYWLYENGIVTEDVFRDAEEVYTINTVLEVANCTRSHSELVEEVRKALEQSY